MLHATLVATTPCHGIGYTSTQAINRAKTVMKCIKMADKKPHRKIVPVYCDQPPPNLEPWEDTWATLNNFSPERLGDPFPLPNRTASTKPCDCHQPSAHASQKVARNEIIPSPKKGRYNSGPSTSFNAAVPNATLTKHKLKVGCLQFCSAPY